MFLSTKELIFFVLVFTILFFSPKAVSLLEFQLKLENTVSIFLMSFLGALLLMLIYKFSKIAHCQADGFNFEVTPAKKCQGGPYMWSSASKELQDYCNKLEKKEYDKVNCGNRGFIGRPIKFEYTPESNHKWENERL
jgi:hypothetical protein